VIYNYKVFAQNRRFAGDDLRMALALQDCLEDGIEVANCSWGTSALADGRSREARAFNEAWGLGLSIVKSAGNGGPARNSISAPGEVDGVIVVGATDRAGTLVPAYSSRGPTFSGEQRPHLVAPGGTDDEGVETVGCGGLAITWGTSIAAPHVTGVIALMLQSNRNRLPDEVRVALTDCAVEIPGADPTAQGAGLLDASGIA
jgi:serine protease AprX